MCLLISELEYMSITLCLTMLVDKEGWLNDLQYIVYPSISPLLSSIHSPIQRQSLRLYLTQLMLAGSHTHTNNTELVSAFVSGLRKTCDKASLSFIELNRAFCLVMNGKFSKCQDTITAPREADYITKPVH